MAETTEQVRKMAYYPPKTWERLRERLFRERKTYAEWAREQADQYLAGKNPS